jgi:hypothetical protein
MSSSNEVKSTRRGRSVGGEPYDVGIAGDRESEHEAVHRRLCEYARHRSSLDAIEAFDLGPRRAIRGRAPYELELRWAYAPMPVGLSPAAREALIDQRVSEAIASVMLAQPEAGCTVDQIRPTPDIDQLRRQRVPRGTTTQSNPVDCARPESH